jgi:hypothetical protein
MKTTPGVAAAVFGGVLALAGGLGWLLYEAGGSSTPDSPGGAPVAPDKKGPARRVRSEPEELPQPAPDPNHSEVARPIPKDGRVRFEFEGCPDLALRDWSEVAGAVKAMNTMFVDLMEKGVPGAADRDRIDRMSKTMERFQRAVYMRPAGSLSMGRATPPEHPAYAVNLIAATLDAEKLSLTEQQSRRLVELAKARAPLYEAAVAASDKPEPGAWSLELLAETARVTESFWGEVNGTLNAAQSAALVPDVLRNRARADFFSAASAWGRLAEPISFATEADLAGTITDSLASQFGLAERKAELRKIVEAWVSSFSTDVPDDLDRKGFMRSRYVSAAVPRMVDLLKQVIQGMQLPEEAAAGARQIQRAYVPMRN